MIRCFAFVGAILMLFFDLFFFLLWLFLFFARSVFTRCFILFSDALKQPYFIK